METAERITAWSAAAIGILGSLGKTIYDILDRKNKARQEEVKIASDVANETTNREMKILEKYQVFTDRLESALHEAREEFKSLQKEHLSCREENARMQTRIGYLEEKVASLEKKLGPV